MEISNNSMNVDDNVTMVNNFTMDQLPESVICLVMGICGLSILLNAICLPVSALNFAMIAQTALLHRNLKFLLLLQSIGVAIFAISEIVRMSIKILINDFFPIGPFSKIMFIITLLAIIFTGWVAFWLLCERILATVKCRTYEGDNRLHFCIFSFIFIFFATFGCYYSAMGFNINLEKIGMKTSISTLYEVYTFLVISFICMMILFYILAYNKRRYAKLEFLSANQSNQPERLSMKYQLSENIRTSRQLLPSAIFHFISVLLTILSYLLNYYGIMSKNAIHSSIVSNSIFLLFSFCNLGIQISVITMHPVLNRRLRRMIGPARMASLWRRKVGQTPAKRTEKPLNIFGNDLLNKNCDIGEYFKVLDTFWNK